MTSLINCSVAVLCLVALSWLSTVSGCDLLGQQACPHDDEFKKPKLDLLFSPTELDFIKTCRHIAAFLRCAGQDYYVSGCGQHQLASLIGFNSTYSELCVVNTKAYYRSRQCALKVRENVDNCILDFLAIREDHCDELKPIRMCFRKAVVDEVGCDVKDKIFIGRLSDMLLSPYAHADLHNCDMPTFEGEEETTPDIETTEPMTTETTTSSTTTTTTTDAITKETKSTPSSKNGDSKENKKEVFAELQSENNSKSRSADVTSVVAIFATFILFLF